MSKKTVLDALQTGETTLRELRGISDSEMAAGINAGRRLMEAGQYQAASELLAGLALYDPFRSDVWRAIEELYRRNCRPTEASFFASLARAMA